MKAAHWISSPLIERVRAAEEQLRPSERAVARIVLARPQEVIRLSFAQIARAGGVSQPTVARFCKALGFTGYRDFKLALAQSIAKGIPYVHHDVNPGDSVPEICAKVFDREIAALVSVRNHLDTNAAHRAVELLSRARRIEFYGLGNSGIVAMDGQHKFFRLGVSTVAYADPHVHAVAATLLGSDDVVVAISASGRTVDLIQSVRLAKAAGAAVIALTRSSSPLAQQADVALFADVSEHPDLYAPMASRLAHLVILDALAVGVAAARSPQVVEHLERAKQVIASKRINEA